ncbi:MAG: ATP-binding cassette domain-containing protein [Prevotella sp.]|nr:ATP-binding cassette domain-containing protein [Prevotella sp.]
MLIDYKNVTITQVDGKEVLKGVNLNVDDGEFVYIIGRVGSGKSSLLKTIYGELDIDEADCATVLEHDMLTIRRRAIPRLRRKMGIVFQDFQLLADRSVENNLRFVLRATGWDQRDRIEERIDQVLDAVGMTDKRTKMPHDLSGGEQQRVAIARAILNRPDIIVADEPTANLDPVTADGIMDLLCDISEMGTAVVMSTHNLPLLEKYPGRVYKCEEGRMERIVQE